ncbi:peptidyl-prolyl cis-trans isomerase cyclophilin-type family protein [Dorcoceras hygrometricum]|uniref:Peptidyl-prolyl cis-trans isomerase cyclophilin-type family protein n=1 Tax=Dorcoceras hygrometricum TaxID=472368 RepID=A0A2Z7DA85_9LAMI|nr:peptidyl-prolyl cis-trans isomerase cyclophilin-type family protein [Dorcoceras hygrometricum]
MHSSSRLLCQIHQLPPKPLQFPATQAPPSSILRRELTFSSLLLFMIGPLTPKPLRAETLVITPDKATLPCVDKIPEQGKQAFLDVSINGEPVGRIVIGLYSEDVPSGSSRFSDLVSGAGGVSYRRKEFVKIMPNYVQHGGLRYYGGDADIARKTGTKLSVLDGLLAELDKQNGSCVGTKNVAKTVSIIVKDPLKPPPKLTLVARKGKLELGQEEVGTDPNGTEFVIATKDSPELDVSALVVGRVIEGMDVVERIGRVETVKDNTTSPYFRAAKLIGDKRAVVAERGFNRPYSKVVITNCGLIMDST